MTGALAGKVAAVTGCEWPLGAGLAGALAAGGAEVHRSTGLPATRESADALFPDRPLDAAVLVAVPGEAMESRPFEEVDDASFDAVWEGTMRATLFGLQASFSRMRDRGGRIVVVSSTLSMSGAAESAPYAAAAEGQRLLAKSAARQWGPRGITVNCVAPAPDLMTGKAPDVSLAPPALGGPGDPFEDIGPLVVYLASDAAHFVTGATVCADGGVWMSP